MSTSSEQRLSALEQTVEGLRTAFNKNHGAYAEVFAIVDGHISVIRNVINGIRRNDVHVDNDDNIDWQVYYQKYNEQVTREAEEAAVAQAASGQPLEPVEAIFGGDYGTGSVSSGRSEPGG